MFVKLQRNSMKGFKTIKLLFSILFIGTMCASCSFDKNAATDLYSVIATLCKTDDGTWYFRDDTGITMQVSPAISFRDTYVDKRFYLEFSKLSNNSGNLDLTIQLYHIEQVIIQPVLDIYNQTQNDSIGCDPIDVYGLWASGHFINLMYDIYWEGNHAHYINLVRDINIADSIDNGIPVVFLELRHNARNEASLTNYSGLMSFDYSTLLTSFQNSDSIRFTISYKDYDREQKSTVITVPTKQLQKTSVIPLSVLKRLH